MSDEHPKAGKDPHPKPLQFRLRTLLVVTALVAMLFSALDWFGVSQQARIVILAVLGVSVLAAVALLVVVAASSYGEDDSDDRGDLD